MEILLSQPLSLAKNHCEYLLRILQNYRSIFGSFGYFFFSSAKTTRFVLSSHWCGKISYINNLRGGKCGSWFQDFKSMVTWLLCEVRHSIRAGSRWKGKVAHFMVDRRQKECQPVIDLRDIITPPNVCTLQLISSNYILP